LEQLEGLANLKTLWLSGTGLVDAELQGLRDAMPNLKITR
jgi:hypothetical protein